MEFKHLFFIFCFISAIFSEITSVKADFIETVASMILFMIVTTLICAGIGWFHKRKEASY